ncbi:MAG: hypothetical protein ACRD6X_05975 [Pyrinomonadaceae bacterium]
MNVLLIRKPSAFLPLAMSIAGLTLVLVHVAIYGIVREADEGTPAHIFQLLMGVQVPIVGYFIARWVTRSPGDGVLILIIQGAAFLAAILAVIVFT